MKKHFLAALIVLCLLVALLPAMAMAADGHYLTFSSDAPFTLQTKNAQKNWDGTLYYSTDASTWTEWNGTEITAAAGKLYLRGTGNKQISGEYNAHFVLDGSAGIACTGNIETLLDYQKAAKGEHPEMGASCFAYLFCECTLLTTAPELPATTLADSCYDSMFDYCKNLTTAPELPATTLADSCYDSMFDYCKNLTTAPKLPATELAANCYERMFAVCTSLTTAPELPATQLAEGCYYWMFSGCTSLTVAPELPATTLADNCYQSMFANCSNLTTAPELPATTLANGCYYKMFDHCTNLTAAPKLPATTLASKCYFYMFNRCEKLTTAPELPAKAMAESCYKGMFSHCYSLTAVPERLPATTLADHCYEEMFLRCDSLSTIPELPATTLAANCYENMFIYCDSLKLSATPIDGYTRPWGIPANATAAADWNTNMFFDGGVKLDGAPEIGTIYYLPDQYAITLNANHKDGCTHDSTVTATYDATILTYPNGSYPPVYTDGYEHITYALQGWFTAAVGGEKIIDADGKLLLNTSCTDENGLWKSLAPPTLYAQWKQIIYPATDPTGGTAPQTAAQGEELTFRVDADAAKLIAVQVDGKPLVPGRDFTITDNPLTVTLTPACVSTLSPGAHTLSVLFTDGVANAPFTILPAPVPAVPQTGDPAPIALWVGLCVCAACGVVALRRKKA